MNPLDNAAPAPSALLYLASFNAAERAVIEASHELEQAIRGSDPAHWLSIVEQHQAAQREALDAARTIRRRDLGAPEMVRQHRYVTSILDRELPALASMHPNSGRNRAVFKLVCRIGRWVHHGVITRADLQRDVIAACERNGLMRDNGRKDVLATIAAGLARSAADPLPDLEVRYG